LAEESALRKLEAEAK